MGSVKDGGGGRGVGAEGHTIVVEVCTGVEFVDTGDEGVSPDFKTKFSGEEGEEGEFRREGFEGRGEFVGGFFEGVALFVRGVDGG